MNLTCKLESGHHFELPHVQHRTITASIFAYRRQRPLSTKRGHFAVDVVAVVWRKVDQSELTILVRTDGVISDVNTRFPFHSAYADFDAGHRFAFFEQPAFNRDPISQF